MNQKTGTAAIVAIACAVGSYVAVCTGHAFWGGLAAVIGIVAGIIGLMMAASPRVSGGILSLIAIAMSVVGIVLAVLVGVFGLLV